MSNEATPEVAPKPPKTGGEKSVKAKKEKPPKPEKAVKPLKVKAAKPPKVKKEKAPKAPREKKPLNKKLVLIIAIAVLVLLLVGVGLFITKMLSGKGDDKKAENASSDIVSSESIDGEASSATEGASADASSAEGDSSADGAASDEGRDAVEGDAPDASAPASSTSSTEMVGGAGGVSPAPKEEKPFVFDERSLTLPPYSYRTTNSLERAVHNDLQAMLDSKDDRPGVGIAAVVIADSYVMENGTLRVLAYVWSNRYAIAENTLFDYGSMAGPVAIDYAGAGVYALDQIHLPRAGDAYEPSVKDMCGPKEETAKRMIRKGYDLELRGQMIRNVSSYITQNKIDADYFRAGAQTYHKNGEIYISKSKNTQSSQAQQAPESLTESSEVSAESSEAGAAESSEAGAAASSEAPVTQDAQLPDEKHLEEEYKNVQKLPL